MHWTFGVCAPYQKPALSEEAHVNSQRGRQPNNGELKQRRRRDDIDNTTKEYVL